MTHSSKLNPNTVVTKSLSPVVFEGNYKLSLVNQHSLEVESFVENGRQKSVHYVIKNSAFVIEVALRKLERSTNQNSDTKHRDSDLDFRKITLEAALLYDCEEDKPVMKVRSRPLTTRGLVNPATPNVCKLETTIEVLSSQHEDMNFKIKLFAVDTATGKRIDGISPVYSAPIQVISKPEVLVKKKQRTKKGPRNKTKQDQILEILSRMESKQNAQQSQIDSLLATQSVQLNPRVHPAQPPRITQAAHTSTFIDSTPASAPGHLGKKNFSSFCAYEEPDLESSYFQFLQAYGRVKRHERPSKLRKLFANTSPSDLSNFMEASSYLQSQQYISPPTQQEHSPFTFLEDNNSASFDQLFAELNSNS